MKKRQRSYIFSISIFISFIFLGCSHNFNYNLDPLDLHYGVNQWEGQRYYSSEKRQVYLTVTDDIDFLYWTKSNGELLYTDKDYRFTPIFHGNEKLSFDARKEPYVFDFSNLEPDFYILNIHYKDTAKNSDNDFRGSVAVFSNVIISDKINGKHCGDSCRKMGKATLQNDSSIIAKNKDGKDGGNVINEYYYAEFVSHNKKKHKTNFFKIIYKINITLKPGEEKVILLPIPKSGTPNTESGLIAYPVVIDGNVHYFGKMVDGIKKDGFVHPMKGSINFDVEPIGDNMLSCSWN